MVRGNGFEVKIKPDSYAASNVADRYVWYPTLIGVA
jgi:predicted RNase H-related nuclease YkuK (DUF458 family)